MVDPGWKKFIIKVECEKHSSSTEATGTTVYICRTCPAFRTQTRESAELHLSQTHSITCNVDNPIAMDQGPLNVNINGTEGLVNAENVTYPNSSKYVSSISPSNHDRQFSEDLEPSASVSPPTVGDSSTASLSLVSPLLAVSSLSPTATTSTPPIPSPSAPQSPLSPMVRELLTSNGSNHSGNSAIRKRITITLSTSPTAAGVPISALPPSSDRPLEDQEGHPVINVQLSSISPNTIKTNHCVPLKDQLKSTSQAAVYVCTQCGHRFVRSKTLEKHLLREHGLSVKVTADATTALDQKPSARILDGPQFPCDSCDRVFSSKQACELHSRCHKHDKKFICSLCLVGFTQPAQLNRHIVSIHGIVPEPDYLDNPDDKDFELSDSEEESEDEKKKKNNNSVSCLNRQKAARSRKRRNTTPSYRHANGARNADGSFIRGRPKRSSDGLVEAFRPSTEDSLTTIPPVTAVQIAMLEGALANEGRYRTILPRPSRGGSTSTPPPPITLIRSKRTKRSKRTTPTPSNNPGVINSSLCESFAHSIDHESAVNTLGSPAQSASHYHHQNQQHTPPTRTIYMDASTLMSQFVNIDGQPQQQTNFNTSGTTYQSVEMLTNSAAGSGILEEMHGKHARPHVLTVAAAYASQLPPGSCVPGVTEDSNSMQQQQQQQQHCPSSTEFSGEVDAGGTVSMFSVPQGSVIPGIQIYPSPWIQPTDPNHTTHTGTPSAVTVTGAEQEAHETLLEPTYIDSTPVSGSEATGEMSASEYLQQLLPLSPQHGMHSNGAQQSVQLYPVLSADGQTTLYYMAAPMDSLTDAANGQALTTIGSPETYYTIQPDTTGMTWTMETDASVVTMNQAMTSTTIATTTTASAAAAASVVTTTGELLNHTDEQGNTVCQSATGETDGNGVMPIYLHSNDPADELAGAYYTTYSIASDAIGDASEAIEVIDLDASKFSAQFYPDHTETQTNVDDELTACPVTETSVTAFVESEPIDAPAHVMTSDSMVVSISSINPEQREVPAGMSYADLSKAESEACMALAGMGHFDMLNSIETSDYPTQSPPTVPSPTSDHLHASPPEAEQYIETTHAYSQSCAPHAGLIPTSTPAMAIHSNASHS